MRILLAALLVAGCYRESTPSTGQPANRQQASAEVTSDVLAFIPKDSDIVVGADLAKLRASPLWSSQIEPLITNNGGEHLTKIRSTCGFDPLVAVSHVAFGTQKTASSEATVVARGIDPRRAIDCVAKLVGQQAQTTRDGDTLVISEQGQPYQVALSPLGRSAVLGLAGPGANRGLAASRVQSGTPLRSSPAFVALFDRLERGAAVWFIANGAAPALKDLASMGMKPRYIDGTVDVTDRYAAVIRVTFATPDEATNIVTMANQFGGQVRQMVERFDVRADGPVARFDLTMTSAQAQTLMGMLGMSF